MLRCCCFVVGAAAAAAAAAPPGLCCIWCPACRHIIISGFDVSHRAPCALPCMYQVSPVASPCFIYLCWSWTKKSSCQVYQSDVSCVNILSNSILALHKLYHTRSDVLVSISYRTRSKNQSIISYIKSVWCFVYRYRIELDPKINQSCRISKVSDVLFIDISSNSTHNQSSISWNSILDFVYRYRIEVDPQIIYYIPGSRTR